ncbi:hypothetical protein BJV82DRAFT_668848 [Fennellomyces sp. T-0311]|nr:hypothetical protein BJV82DRAFT_668848 [Fennellomyces sp. T-0311]
MLKSQRLRVGLLSLVLLSITGLVFRWHLTNDKPLQSLPTPEATEETLPPPFSYDKQDPRISKVLQNIDKKYCGGPCRFMLPVFIMEQESKAQMHFRQLAFMAGMINRTIVLPQVGGSRLGACLEHDFGFYYSEDWAPSNADHFSYIAMDKFTAWVKERKAVGFPSTSQTFHVHLSRDHKQIGESDNCFAPLMDNARFSEKSIYLHDSGNVRRRKKYQKIIKDFFTEKDPKASDEPEVMSVYYDRRFPFIHNTVSENPIPYNDQITKAANAIADAMSPYLAVHWRTERAEPAENLVGCAESLTDLIQDRASQLGLSSPTFFLLTDYPHVFDQKVVDEAVKSNSTENDQGFVPASASFSAKSLTVYHHRAIQYLYSHFKVTVTSLEADMMDDKSPANWTVLPVQASLAKQDSGILGIIDKLLAIRADLFMAGKPGVCARRSSFTGRIVDERIARRLDELKDTHQWLDDMDETIEEWTDYSRKGPGRMKNIIEYFDL